MKKINKKTLLVSIMAIAIITCLVFQSCQNEGVNLNEEKINFDFKETSKPVIDKISDLIELNKTEQPDKNSKLHLSKEIIDKIDFDLKNSISLFSNDVELIVVNQKGLSYLNAENTAITFIKDKEDIYRNFIVKAINISENVKKFEYYNFDNSLVFSTVFNNNDKTITNIKNVNGVLKERVISFAIKPSLSLSDLIEIQTANAECMNGTAVMDCVSDVYSNHGWLSVWVWVQTGFLPQTGAAFALACAVDSCL